MRKRPRATTGSLERPSMTSATRAPKRRAIGSGSLRTPSLSPIESITTAVRNQGSTSRLDSAS